MNPQPDKLPQAELDAIAAGKEPELYGRTEHVLDGEPIDTHECDTPLVPTPRLTNLEG